jgi:hypothetical protein
MSRFAVLLAALTLPPSAACVVRAHPHPHHHPRRHHHHHQVDLQTPVNVDITPTVAR